MKALKFLERGARGRFSGHAWPTPEGATPGAWVEARGPLAPCARGIHACRATDLAYWLDDELWHIELGGELVHERTMVVAERGRLLAREPAWNAALRDEFGQFCAQRADTFAARAATADAATLARRHAREVRALATSELATAAYVSAIAARCAPETTLAAAFDDERAAQSAWLAARLG